jgi:hypothetical protein
MIAARTAGFLLDGTSMSAGTFAATNVGFSGDGTSMSAGTFAARTSADFSPDDFGVTTTGATIKSRS